MNATRRHLLSLRELSRAEITSLLDAADSFKSILARPIKKVPTLRGRSVVTLFFENSTRTRTSFELAAKTMSAEAINIAVAQSSAAKGESLKDTLLTLDALTADCVIIRHGSSGAPALAAKYVRGHVVNAGDGTHEHPTQGLLDLLTIRDTKGTIEGLNVSIIGDILHSRVARSALWGLKTCGANVTLCGPDTLLPPEFAAHAKLTSNCDEAILGADVVMTLRLQAERMNGAYLPNAREFSRLYGMNRERLKRANKDAIVMHPGPINRGVEISDDLADDAQSVILQQVHNGVAVRMAVLYELLGGGEE